MEFQLLLFLRNSIDHIWSVVSSEEFLSYFLAAIQLTFKCRRASRILSPRLSVRSSESSDFNSVYTNKKVYKDKTGTHRCLPRFAVEDIMLTMSLLLLLFSILHDVDTNNAAPTLNGNSVRVFKKL